MQEIANIDFGEQNGLQNMAAEHLDSLDSI